MNGPISTTSDVMTTSTPAQAEAGETVEQLERRKKAYVRGYNERMKSTGSKIYDITADDIDMSKIDEYWLTEFQGRSAASRVIIGHDDYADGYNSSAGSEFHLDLRVSRPGSREDGCRDGKAKRDEINAKHRRARDEHWLTHCPACGADSKPKNREYHHKWNLPVCTVCVGRANAEMTDGLAHAWCHSDTGIA